VKCAGQNNETTISYNISYINSSQVNSTTAAADAGDAPWQRRMRELQGAIILASLVEVVLGITGIVGTLVRFIGPLTIAPVITMIALPLANIASNYAQSNWWIAFLYVPLPLRRRCRRLALLL